jgi:hypothetical protein
LADEENYDFTKRPNKQQTHTKHMSTKNHKSATTSDILNTASNNPDIHQSNNPPSTSPAEEVPAINPTIQKPINPFALRARCGKVARLPKEIRDQINEMLLDGVPHVQIIQKLRDQFALKSNLVSLDASPNPDPSDSGHAPVLRSAFGERGSRITHHDSDHATPETEPSTPDTPHSEPSASPSTLATPHSTLDPRHSDLSSLTPHHITTWKKFGGYRDWLKDQQRIADCKMRHELTLDLARSAQGLASYQAAPKVAVAEICQTIVDLGPEGLKEAMQASPLNCFRLLNAMARLINSGLKCETHIQNTAVKTTKERGKMTRSRFARIEKNMNLL